jgi:GH24 family phage-related lysozyme (muramidase)
MEHLQGGAWRGRGADAFYAEMKDWVLPAVDRLVKALEEACHCTGTLTERFQAAEREAAALFVGDSLSALTPSFTPTPTPTPTVIPVPVPTPPQRGTPPPPPPNRCLDSQMSIQVGTYAPQCVSRPGTPSFMSANGVTEEEIRRIASITGVDPLLLTMVLEREWSTSSSGSWSDFLWRLEFFSRGEGVSAGIGNVKADTLIPYLQRHPERFAQWMSSMTDGDGNFIKGEVIWKLFSDREFNFLAAATILADNRARIVENLAAWGVELTPQQIDDFTMVTYNAGIERFMKRLQDRVNVGQSPNEIRQAILRTIDVNEDYVGGARRGVDQEMYAQ